MSGLGTALLVLGQAARQQVEPSAAFPIRAIGLVGLLALVLVLLAGIVVALTSRPGRTILSVAAGVLVAVLVAMFLVIVPWRLAEQRPRPSEGRQRVDVAQHAVHGPDRAESAKGGPVRRALSKARTSLRPEAGSRPSTETNLPAEAPAGDAQPASSADDGRPAWVDAPPRVVDGVYQVVVTAGPFKTRHECELQLEEKLQQAIQDYAEERFGSEAARVDLPLEELRSQIVKEQWEETRESQTPAIGAMIQLHALVGFDRQVNLRIDEALSRVVVARRIWWCATGLGVVLLLLSLVWGYLKTDLATAGAYRWRLRAAAALMILGVVAAAVLAAVS